MIVAIVCLALAVVLATSWEIDAKSVRELSAIALGYFGFGTALLQGYRQLRGLKFLVLGCGVGLSAASLIGYGLLELHLWGLSRPLFVLVVGVTVLMHARAIWQWVRHESRRSGAYAMSCLRRGRAMSSAWGLALSGLGAIVCFIGLGMDQGMIPGPGGFLFSTAPIWIAGVALLVMAVGVAWRKRNASITFEVVALVMVVVGSPVMAYTLPRYPWSQKHVGVVLHLIQAGVVDPKIDIYQSWPALFGGVAWICHAAGVSDVEAIARWWPLVTNAVNLGTVLLLSRLFGIGNRWCVLAGMLFMFGNTIGQDYFSPQSAAFMLFMLIMLMSISPQERPSGFSLFDWGIVVVMVAAVAVMHQLTPFAVAGVLFIFTMWGYARQRMLWLIALCVGLGWSAVHLSEIWGYLANGFGNIFGNVQTPNSKAHYHYSAFIRLGDIGQAVAPVTVGILALVAFLSNRTRAKWCLLVAAGSSLVLIGVVHYGNEDIYRAALFALPWLSILAASREWGTERSRNYREGRGRAVLSAVGIVALTALMTFVYIVGDMGFDDLYVTRPSDIAAAVYFNRTAPHGSTVYVIGGYFEEDALVGARYPNFSDTVVLSDGLAPGVSVEAAARALTATVERRSGRNFYVLGTQQAAVQLNEDGVMTLDQYFELEYELLRSGKWEKVYMTKTALLLRYVPHHARGKG